MRPLPKTTKKTLESASWLPGRKHTYFVSVGRAYSSVACLGHLTVGHALLVLVIATRGIGVSPTVGPSLRFRLILYGSFLIILCAFRTGILWPPSTSEYTYRFFTALKVPVHGCGTSLHCPCLFLQAISFFVQTTCCSNTATDVLQFTARACAPILFYAVLFLAHFSLPSGKSNPTPSAGSLASSPSFRAIGPWRQAVISVCSRRFWCTCKCSLFIVEGVASFDNISVGSKPTPLIPHTAGDPSCLLPWVRAVPPFEK